jgi:hypothetical protein
MIEALATQYETRLALEIVYPDKTPHRHANIIGGTPEQRTAHGMRLVKFEARDFMLAKLTGWLKQRMFAFERSGRRAEQQKCAQLVVFLSYNKDKGFHTFCQSVVKYADAISSLAPSSKSSHYSYYEKMIQVILRYCQDIG